MFICTFGKRKPNPTNESVARFNAHHPSIRKRRRRSRPSRATNGPGGRDEKKKKAINPGHIIPHRARSLDPRDRPARAPARDPARFYPRGSLTPRRTRGTNGNVIATPNATRRAHKTTGGMHEIEIVRCTRRSSRLVRRSPVRRPSSVGRRSTADPWCARGSFRHKTASHDASNAMGLGHDNERR